MKRETAVVIAISLITLLLFFSEIKQRFIDMTTDGQLYALSSEPKTQLFKAILEEKLLIDKRIIAYTNKLVFSHGEPILLHLFGDNELEVKIFKINKSGEKIQVSNFRVDVNAPPMAVYSSFEGVISPSQKVEIDSSTLGSGWFGIQVINSENEMLETPVFVDPSAIFKKVLFVESTDTLLAYNDAYFSLDIPNYYRKNLDKSETAVIPQNTPITYEQLELSRFNEVYCNDHLINSDMINKLNLAELGVDFQSISDELLDNPTALDTVEVLVFGTHNEYWTEAKALNVIDFINRGGKVLLLGGNQAWRQTYREEGRTWVHGKKGLTRNPVFDNLVSQYLGTYFTKVDYDTFAGFKVLDSEALSRYFSLDVEQDTILGIGTRFEHCSYKILGISGHETDKLTEKSEGFIHLAKGLNEGGGSDLVYKSFASGGELLNFSSLSIWHNNDPIIFKIIEKFIKGDN